MSNTNMDQVTAQTLGRKLQISPDYIVREEYEMLLLKQLFESEFGSGLVFKGGTALRLAYGSPRFSEDLDFTLIKEIDKPKLLEFIRGLGKNNPAILNIEAIEKHYTLFGLVKIEEDYLARNFSIKIEISKRVEKWVKDKDFSEQVMKSDVTPLTLLAGVASLKKILSDKKDAMKNRQAARDIFDYWYINQILKRNVKVDFSGHNREQAVAELHRLLPKNYWKVVNSWLA